MFSWVFPYKTFAERCLHCKLFFYQVTYSKHTANLIDVNFDSQQAMYIMDVLKCKQVNVSPQY